MGARLLEEECTANMAELKVSVVLTNKNAQTKGDFLTGDGFST